MSESAGVEGGRFLPELQISPPERHRRWTVLLRLLLLVPHFIVLWALGIAAAVVAIIGWFAALVQGRLPEWISAFLVLYVAYHTRVGASAWLLVDRYPPFVVGDPQFPVDVDIRPGALNRWAVLFRLVLVIPAAIVTTVVSYGFAVLAFFLWLIILVLGRNPRPIFDASAASLRYSMRTNAYFYMLTGAYPKGLFGDTREGGEPAKVAAGTSPLVMSQGGRVVLIVFIVLGALAVIGNTAASSMQQPYPYQHQFDYAG
ncbi:DUF4389 domain-containing protein [Saccharopolyspora rhizosphaerae]|uniref:DUF4389 domain-containing protein n=1 Tax=Saccharopolyspora rhizosphaerae TaxID=2492662 RepID=A0A3R8NWF5_9PSEU|nr:DUF4389 domain-containing protein [Saccharopolyspora rhizosphaerae]RRO14795.1 DUF4389 domain-containing protein [Saccharopolyspora rhizosphaerae]